MDALAPLFAITALEAFFLSLKNSAKSTGTIHCAMTAKPVLTLPGGDTPACGALVNLSLDCCRDVDLFAT